MTSARNASARRARAAPEDEAANGPPPPLLPYGRQTIDDADIAAVVAALKGDWLTQGPTVARFEEAIAARCGAPYCVAVSSGTAALHLASLVGGIEPGRGGVTSDITFVASANGIRYGGGTVALADVDPLTGLATAATIERAVDRLEARGVAPKVLVPVDFAGQVAELPSIAALAARRGLTVIEDAAHALGASYVHEGRTVRAGSCTHSDLAILSFHPVKHITTLEGGAILTRDEGAYRALLELRSHGITKDRARLHHDDGPWYYEQQRLGFHHRLSDVACALGLSQLDKLGAFLAARRWIAARYGRGLAQRGLLDHYRPLPQPHARSAFHLYVIHLVPRDREPLGSIASRRLRLYEHLRARGIAPQVHYIPIHRQPDFAPFIDVDERFPGAEAFYAGCLSLPVFPSMLESDVGRVLDALEEHAASDEARG
ncbi:MAG: DegT/DnrJ/EryC1/StrS family aminotransferase [Sandaracinaceae bacterium]|nr:DegT/DnrJ/EryC1/StrS family aminotransferase [Sandaracinaceae bacterium]